MRRPYSRLAAASALAVAIASLTIGSAFAGGNPNAPGQQKKQDSASQSAASQSAASQSAGSQPTSQSGSPSQGGNGDASQPGMKPANNTAHGTSCTYQSSTTCTANDPKTSQSAAKQDASKHYGNGKTAAQIAASKGVPAGSTIYGPGNSQPHKVTCPGGTKGPDVHAYKAGGKHSCPTTGTPPPAQNSGCTSNCGGCTSNCSSINNNNTSGSCTSNCGSNNNTAPAQNTAPVQNTAPAQVTQVNGAAPAVSSTGGVKGTTTHLGKPKTARAHRGVLGTTARISSGRLPFTGFPTWLAALLGIGMILGGATLRRRAASF